MSATPGIDLSRLAGATDPGELFIRAWDELARLTPADRSAITECDESVVQRLDSALEGDDSAEVAGLLHSLTEGMWCTGSGLPMMIANAAILCTLMSRIDRRYAAIHPRTRILSPRYNVFGKVPAWLQQAKERRFLEGQFLVHSDKRLIPNGPFVRHAIGRDYLAGDSLQDRFPHLTVAPLSTRQEDNEIRIGIKVVGTGRARGLPAAKSIGRERICFIPLAENSNDLAFECGARGDHKTLDVRPLIDSVGRLLEAINTETQSDIVFAPELTVDPANESRLGADITRLLEHAPRILLAGSGLTADCDELGRSWNEARVIARGGATLWRQRKIWPFEMHRDRARQFGLDDPGEGRTLNEDIAGHNEITVVDLDGFGRSIVLICQDFEARIAVDEIVRRYQPDWIFVPILDAGVNVPGWTPNRAATLNKSQSRFVVGSSLTLSRRRGDETDPPVGLAMGPADPTGGPAGTMPFARALAVVKAVPGTGPMTGVIVWDHQSPVWTQLNQGPADRGAAS